MLHRINACFEFVRVESSQLHILAEVWLILVVGSDGKKIIIHDQLVAHGTHNDYTSAALEVDLCSLSLLAYSAQVLHFDLHRRLER